MQKKLEAELVSLAHSILQMKNRDDVLALKEKARNIHEKLSVLAFVDEYVNTTPNLKESKEELLKGIDLDAAVIPPVEKQKIEPKKTVKKEVKKAEGKDIFEPKFESVRIDIESLKSNQISSKEEFKDAISADKTSTLFDGDDKNSDEKKTLNDRLLKKTIQVGLNDRIAFVNHLFNFNQSDFNRVLSQLNKVKSEKEAMDFIMNKVKPDYDWTGKEEYEERLIALVERKFA